MKPRNIYRTNEEKLRILKLADNCTRHGEMKALLSKEKLSSSTLSDWRKKRAEAEDLALSSDKCEREEEKVVNETTEDEDYLQALLLIPEMDPVSFNDWLVDYLEHDALNINYFHSCTEWVDYLTGIGLNTLEEVRDTYDKLIEKAGEPVILPEDQQGVTFETTQLEKEDLLLEHSVASKEQDDPLLSSEVASEDPNDQCLEQAAFIKTAIQTPAPKPPLQTKPVKGTPPPQGPKEKTVKSRFSILALLQSKIPFLQ